MKKTYSIGKNYILNTLYQILALILPLITAPYAARVFGADGNGVYSFTQSIVSVFIIFASLGTLTYGQRTIAQHRDDIETYSNLFWEIEILSVFTTMMTLVGWGILIMISSENRIYFIAFTFELIAVAFDISWLFAGLEQFPHIVFRNLVIKLIGVFSLFTFVKVKSDLVLYITLIAITKLFGNLSMWVKIRSFILKPDFIHINPFRHFRNTINYFIPTIAASIYSYLDKTMIGLITKDSFENGYYYQATRFIQIAYTAIISLNTVMSSRLSYLFQKGRRQEIEDKLETALAYILTVGIPISLGIVGIADGFIPWFLGDGYDKTVSLIYVLSPMVVILSMHNFLSAQYLVPSGQRVRSTKGVIIGAIINFLCNLAFIPFLKSIGAAIATIIAESSICAIYLYMSKEYVSLKMIGKYLPKQLISASLMLLIISCISLTGLHGFILTFIQIIIGALSYFILLLLLREQFMMKMMKLFIRKIDILLPPK